jgi:NAD(P) transhydrogenase
LGGGYIPHTIPQLFAAISVAASFLNVVGGFVITQRMLAMFRRPTDPEEYQYLYAVPGALFAGGMVYAATSGAAGLVQAGYLASSLLCIGSLAGLSSQITARQGNSLGMLGVGAGFLTSLVAGGFAAPVLTQFAVLAGAGGAAGAYIGGRISPIELPQTVAALHSIVGIAAVLTSVASVFSGAVHDPLHLVIAYLGVLVGGITVTGSLVAFGKLAGRLSSKPLLLPNRHLVNGGLLASNVGFLSAFLSYAPTSTLIASGCLLASAWSHFRL